MQRKLPLNSRKEKKKQPSFLIPPNGQPGNATHRPHLSPELPEKAGPATHKDQDNPT
jgi:hypothetical protein